MTPERLDYLVMSNESGAITPPEYEELEDWITASQQNMKAYSNHPFFLKDKESNRLFKKHMAIITRKRFWNKIFEFKDINAINKMLPYILLIYFFVSNNMTALRVWKKGFYFDSFFLSFGSALILAYCLIIWRKKKD